MREPTMTQPALASPTRHMPTLASFDAEFGHSGDEIAPDLVGERRRRVRRSAGCLLGAAVVGIGLAYLWLGIGARPWHGTSRPAFAGPSAQGGGDRGAKEQL